MEFTSRKLRAFHLVAQQRSFTKDAESLFITPSGLSVVIRELKNQLGFRLFDRTTRRVPLTAHGTQLLAVSQRSLEELDFAISRLERRVKVTAESLSVGATPLIGHKAAGVGALMRRPWRHHRADHAAFHLRFTG